MIEEILQEEILDEHDRSREVLERRKLANTKQILSASLLRKLPVAGDEESSLEPSPIQQVGRLMMMVMDGGTHASMFTPGGCGFGCQLS